MTEELVTLETAELLKEKGFNERKYIMDVSTLPYCYRYLSVPPQSIAQKWLRETKNLHIEISYMYENYWRMAKVLNQIFSKKIIAKLGYSSMLDYYLVVCEN